MLVSHLPDGPTAYFKLSNVKLTKDMKVLVLFTKVSLPTLFKKKIQLFIA